MVCPSWVFIFTFSLGRYPRLDLELPVLLSSPVDTEDDKEKWGVLGNDNCLAPWSVKVQDNSTATRVTETMTFRSFVLQTQRRNSREVRRKICYRVSGGSCERTRRAPIQHKWALDGALPRAFFVETE